MMKIPTGVRVSATIASLAVAVLTLVAAGCKKEEPAPQPSPPAESAPADESASAAEGAAAGLAAAANTAAKDAAGALLARVDAHDGTTDKVVSECVMCGLRMKGSPDHAAQHAGYTLQLCSSECKKHFEDGPEAALAALDVPAE